jgi:hypothetical protein
MSDAGDLAAAVLGGHANVLPPLADVESTYGIRVNAVSVHDLFALYERAGFLYPAKAARLIPYMDRVRENWRRLLQAGDALLYILTAGDEGDGLASIAVWRTTRDGWTWQHLVCQNNPLQSRALMLGGLVRCMQRGDEKSQQNWFRPENRFPSRVFGTMVRSVGESLSSVQEHVYFALPRAATLPTDGAVQIVPYGYSERDALRRLTLGTRGAVYLSAEELERDVELQAVDDLYRRVGLRRTRRVWLAYRHGTDEAVGAAIAYRGPLGLNFSFIENRCDLLPHQRQSESDVAAVTATLLQAAAAAYADFELDDIPVVADRAAAPALSAMGGRFLRHYCQGIWLKHGQPSLYRHVDRFYTRLVNRAERRSAQTALTA